PGWGGDGLVAVTIRRPDSGKGGPRRAAAPPGAPKARKYHMLRGSRRGLYPGRQVLVPGKPLILAEGEFDALLLNQELAGLVPAVTLGSAGDRHPSPSVLLALTVAAPWYLRARPAPPAH